MFSDIIHWPVFSFTTFMGSLLLNELDKERISGLKITLGLQKNRLRS